MINIAADSPGTPPFEMFTSTHPDDFMKDEQQTPQQKDTSADGPSCSFTPPITKTSTKPTDIMKSTSKIDKRVKKIWQQKPDHEALQATTTLDDSSTEDYPVQPPIKKVELVYLDSTESTENTGEQDDSQAVNQEPADTTQDEMR